MGKQTSLAGILACVLFLPAGCGTRPVPADAERVTLHVPDMAERLDFR